MIDDLARRYKLDRGRVAIDDPAAEHRLIANTSFANRSRSAIEPVCGMSKRKLENGGQRLAPQNLGSDRKS
jgi:hypothetical protein